MQIEVKGRHVAVSDDVRDHVEKRFAKIAKQVSQFAQLEIEVSRERNPAIADPFVVDATLHLKGVTLRAQESARDPLSAVNLVRDDLARQVKRHRDKRRKRREARTEAMPGDVSPAL
jgi:putative sigma-54 modulation protein